jgi:hypothetical protein
VILQPQFSIRTLLWLTLAVAIGCVLGQPAAGTWRESKRGKQLDRERIMTIFLTQSRSYAGIRP